MALKTMVARLDEARKNYNDTLAEVGKQAREEIAKALGEVIPEGKVLVWAAFTPYFNDGSPCRYHVGDPIYQNEPDDLAKIKRSWTTWDGAQYDCPGDEIDDVWGSIPEDMMLKAYGDHVLVIVRRGGEYLAKRYEDHD